MEQFGLVRLDDISGVMGISFVDEVGDVLVGGKGLAEGDEFGADELMDGGHTI